jgi:hypothetical protein
VDGSEIRGSSNASVLFKYGTYTGLARFTVWMPEFPLEVSVTDTRLNQIKGWKVAEEHPIAKNKRSLNGSAEGGRSAVPRKRGASLGSGVKDVKLGGKAQQRVAGADNDEDEDEDEEEEEEEEEVEAEVEAEEDKVRKAQQQQQQQQQQQDEDEEVVEEGDDEDEEEDGDGAEEEEDNENDDEGEEGEGDPEGLGEGKMRFRSGDKWDEINSIDRTAAATNCRLRFQQSPVDVRRAFYFSFSLSFFLSFFLSVRPLTNSACC